ncbi:MAG TPA: glycosyltransferase, partial [Patescibacteria group bacterium]|nr:glycosyltransferase [Patescibacteria group bacterium]
VWIGGQTFNGVTEQGKELPHLLKKLPPNVHFPGIFAYEDMPAIQNAADVFFFPSFQENAPMGPLEAASVSLPLVLRDLIEYKALYKENYLAGHTHDDFHKLLRKLAHDKSFYREASQNSHKLASHFSFATRSKQLLTYYNSLLKK